MDDDHSVPESISVEDVMTETRYSENMKMEAGNDFALEGRVPPRPMIGIMRPLRRMVLRCGMR